MLLYISNDSDYFDIESAELIYVYVKSCKVFKNTGFCLHPKYEIQESFERSVLKISINEKNSASYVDLFGNQNINLKIFCGKNGSGKTTLLNILQKDNTPSCIYVFKNEKGNFAASEKILVCFNGEEKEISKQSNQTINPKYCCSIHENMNLSDFSLNKNIVGFYATEKSIFDGILPPKEPLITNFEVRIFQSDFDEIFAMASNFLSQEEAIDFEVNGKKDWLLFYCVSCLCDSSCQKLVNARKGNLLDPLRKHLNKCKKIKNFRVFFDHIKELKGSFGIKDYEKIQVKLKKTSGEAAEFVKKIFGDDIFIAYGLSHFLHCLGYAQIKGQKRFINDLSTGEYLCVKYRYELFHSLAQSDRMYLTYDEPESGLHPEWCRQFLKNYLDSYKKALDYCSKRMEHFNKEKRMSIFISTHSPFILSDVTNDYIIYLQKMKNGYSREVKNQKDTFAGNIGEMFTTNFFMDATIGEYASNEIRKIIKKRKLNDNEKKIVANIGDELLKKILNRRFNINEEN